MILKILQGTDKESTKRLQQLSDEIGENPNILWYPSAGADFRDIMELEKSRAAEHNISSLPDLLIHNSYINDTLNSNDINISFDDGRTTVEIEQKFELQISTNVEYKVNSKYVEFPNMAPENPIVYLIDVKLTSNKFGVIRRPILYFIFENINFLDQIILKHNLRISHIAKVREGCGFGGNRKSISVVYAFLSAMNTDFLIVDNEEHTDFEIIENLKKKHNLNLKSYELNKISTIDNWSGFEVGIFSVKYNNSSLNSDELNNALKKISNS